MNLCQMVEGLFRVWQIFAPPLEKLNSFWVAFQCCPILKQGALWL